MQQEFGNFGCVFSCNRLTDFHISIHSALVLENRQDCR